MLKSEIFEQILHDECYFRGFFVGRNRIIIELVSFEERQFVVNNEYNFLTKLPLLILKIVLI